MNGSFPLFAVADGTDFQLLGDGPRGLHFLQWLLTSAGSESSARLRLQLQSSYAQFHAQNCETHRPKLDSQPGPAVASGLNSPGASCCGSSSLFGNPGTLEGPSGQAKRERTEADGGLSPGPRRQRIAANLAVRDHGVQPEHNKPGDLVSQDRLRRAHIIGEFDGARMRGQPQGFAEVPYVANLPKNCYWCVLQCRATTDLPPGLYNRWRNGAQVLVTETGSSQPHESAVFRSFASLREVESYYAGAKALPVPRVSSYAGMAEGPAE